MCPLFFEASRRVKNFFGGVATWGFYRFKVFLSLLSTKTLGCHFKISLPLRGGVQGLSGKLSRRSCPSECFTPRSWRGSLPDRSCHPQKFAGVRVQPNFLDDDLLTFSCKFQHCHQVLDLSSVLSIETNYIVFQCSQQR